MSYTITRYGQPLPVQKLTVDGAYLGSPFVTEWECDPCRLPGRRYRMLEPYTGEWVELAWWELITEDDDERTRELKQERARSLHELRLKAWDTARELHWREVYG